MAPATVQSSDTVVAFNFFPTPSTFPVAVSWKIKIQIKNKWMRLHNYWNLILVKLNMIWFPPKRRREEMS